MASLKGHKLLKLFDCKTKDHSVKSYSKIISSLNLGSQIWNITIYNKGALQSLDGSYVNFEFDEVILCWTATTKLFFECSENKIDSFNIF